MIPCALVLMQIRFEVTLKCLLQPIALKSSCFSKPTGKEEALLKFMGNLQSRNSISFTTCDIALCLKIVFTVNVFKYCVVPLHYARYIQVTTNWGTQE